MSLHLSKLSVGVDDIRHLARIQAGRLAEARSRGDTPELRHVTRNTPRRAAEILDGGSLYWVIKGQIAVRQRLVALRPVVRNERPHCALVLDPKLVPIMRRAHRAFQGWRYLTPKDAPRDLRAGEADLASESLCAELTALGLI